MIQRMVDNDKIVTRHIDDKDFQGVIFPLLAKEIFMTLYKKDAESKQESTDNDIKSKGET